MKNRNTNESEKIEKRDIVDDILDYYISSAESRLLSNLRQNNEARRKFLENVEGQLELRHIKIEDRQDIKDKISKFLWGYYILDELISDKVISDIKIYDYDHITIKKLGQREIIHNIQFKSREDYKKFVSSIAVKNKIAVSDINAIADFSDKHSSEDFILRFNITTGLINSSGVPCVHIRKEPKLKKTIKELIDAGMLTNEQAEFLTLEAVKSKGIFVTGKGSAGKTTLINSLIEYIPHDRSILVVQENEELFSNTHPEIDCKHVVLPKGESRIKYTLGDIFTNGLRTDVDYCIMGEIKGGEAADFAQAAYTGYQCWASGHGMSCSDGINKLADNIMKATGFKKSDVLKMLVGLEVVVFLKEFKATEIVRLDRYDPSINELVYNRVF